MLVAVIQFFASDCPLRLGLVRKSPMSCLAYGAGVWLALQAVKWGCSWLEPRTIAIKPFQGFIWTFSCSLTAVAALRVAALQCRPTPVASAAFAVACWAVSKPAVLSAVVLGLWRVNRRRSSWSYECRRPFGTHFRNILFYSE